MRIELHIDRLVLDGVAEPHQAAAIRDALHAELTRLLTTAPPGVWRPRTRPLLRAPEISTGRAEAVGGSIAKSVHQVVSHGA